MINFLPQLIAEYFLIAKNKLNQSKPTVEWNTGTVGDILLIPGLHESWVFLQSIGILTNQLGCKVHIVPSYNSSESVNAGYEQIKQYIQTKKLNLLTIIAHSKGGVIAKKLLMDKNLTNKIKRVITIATPFGGSILAYVWPDAYELNPKSPIIAQILQDQTGNSKIYNLYPRVDNHVIPNRNLLLIGANNVMIDIVGHTRILEADQTKKVIKKIISSTDD